MKRTVWGTLMILALPVLLPAQTSTASVAVTVDCSDGQSLNRALSKLGKHVPATVAVKGTCSEYVQVLGFENLMLQGLPGAAIVEPATVPSSTPPSVLFIGASSSVTVSGFNIQAASTTGPSAVGVGHGSSDVRLLNLQVTGGGSGIAVFENSQVLLSHVTGQNAGYTVLGVYDSSDVHIEHCLFQDTTGTSWHAGIDLLAAHITMFDDTLRDFQAGINASSAIIDLVSYNTYTPPGGPTDVLIDSPAGNNYFGVALSDGSSLNLFSAKLIINQPGQQWGGNTGGILVSDGSTLEASNGELVITGSHGQGIVVENNSHATLMGVSVTGSGHGGVVVDNLSTVDVNPMSGLTLVGGSGVDLFCDQSSTITGGANLAGVPTSQCKNVSTAEALLP